MIVAQTAGRTSSHAHASLFRLGLDMVRHGVALVAVQHPAVALDERDKRRNAKHVPWFGEGDGVGSWLEVTKGAGPERWRIRATLSADPYIAR